MIFEKDLIEVTTPGFFNIDYMMNAASCYSTSMVQTEEPQLQVQGWDFVYTDTIRSDNEAINDEDENINLRCERKRQPHFIGADILSL